MKRKIDGGDLICVATPVTTAEPEQLSLPLRIVCWAVWLMFAYGLVTGWWSRRVDQQTRPDDVISETILRPLEQ